MKNKGKKYIELKKIGLVPEQEREINEYASSARAVNWKYRDYFKNWPEARNYLDELKYKKSWHWNGSYRDNKKIRGEKKHVAGKYLEMQTELNQCRKNWEILKEKSIPLSKVEKLDWSNYETFIKIGEKILYLYRHEVVTWPVRYKHGQYPESKKITYWAQILSPPTLKNYRPVFTIPVKADREIHYNQRGDYLARIFSDLKLVKPLWQKRIPKNIQLSAYYRAKKIRKIFDIEIFQRTLAGQIVDYVAVCGSNTFHANTIKGAITGLNRKRKIKNGTLKIFTKKDLMKQYNFCKSGINNFADETGLDSEKAYTENELRAVITPEIRNKFEKELKTMGI